MSEPILPFSEYEVTIAGIGLVTVIAPEGEPGYRVRLPDGQVTAWPAQSGNPSPENAAADIAHALANPPMQARKDGLLARAAQRRWEREVGGIELEGVTIRTDRESQAMLNGAITFCDLESQAVVNWKAANGWQQLGEMGLRAIALAVGRHVQACFSRERELGELITAATTHQQLDDIAAAIEAFDL